jgi:5-methylcytosine-specific restriction endonuclease McrA
MVRMREKSQIISDICFALSVNNKHEAINIARREYPFEIVERSKRRISDVARTKIFIRDGFIDRYSGQKLVYPGTIMLLAVLLPNEFPYHPNWKMDASHIFFWELWPTIDHVFPIARGGADEESNWICTSMLRNAIKSNWTLDEVGWQLLPPGDLSKWDGLIHWFVDYVEENESILENGDVSKWYQTGIKCLKT